MQNLQQRIGQPVRSERRSWENSDARVTRSNIRSWAVINGDMRPLYVDPDHAGRSRWGSIIAPPAAIMAYEQLAPEIDCLPGTFPVLRAARLELSAPIRMNDVVNAESRVTEVETISHAAADGRIVRCSIATTVTLESGEPVGSVHLDWHLYERGCAAQLGLFDGRGIHEYSHEDVEALKLEYKQETQRGENTLSWHEVAVGERLPSLLKGPTTRSRYITRVRDGWYWGHQQGWGKLLERPELFFQNENNAPEPIMATDWDHHRARRWGGLPGALESNTDRPHYLVQLLANWMGDGGFPTLLDLEFPRQAMIGDVCRSYGRVESKRETGRHGIVTLDVWQTNQLGTTITTGKAEIQLPL